MKLKVLLMLLPGFFGICASAQVLFQKTIGTGFPGEAHSLCLSVDKQYVAACAGSLFKIDTSGNVVWVKKYLTPSMYKNSFVMKQSGGGFVVVYDISSGGFGSDDIMFFNTDTGGNINWIKIYGSTGVDIPYSVAECSNGDFVIAGNSNGLSGSDADVLMMRINKYGDQLWQRTCGSLSTDDNAEKVLVTGSGEFMTAGRIASQIALQKTDLNGVLMWSKTYGLGSLYDMIEQKDKGGFFLCGTSATDDSKSMKNIFVMNTDSAGNVKWAKIIGNNMDEIAYSITSDSLFTKLFIAGKMADDSTGGTRAFSACINAADGSLIWFRQFGQNGADMFSDNLITNNSLLVSLGYTNTADTSLRNVYLAKTALNGESGCNSTDVVPVVDSLLAITAIDLAIATDSGDMSVMTKCYPPALIAHHEFTFCSTAIESVPMSGQISIYPNPGDGLVHINIDPKLAKSIIVYSSTGQQIWNSFERGSDDIAIDLSAFQAGIYFIVIKSEAGSTTSKFVLY